MNLNYEAMNVWIINPPSGKLYVLHERETWRKNTWRMQSFYIICSRKIPVYKVIAFVQSPICSFPPLALREAGHRWSQ